MNQTKILVAAFVALAIVAVTAIVSGSKERMACMEAIKEIAKSGKPYDLRCE